MPADTPAPAPIVCVYAPQGGVGKSFVAQSLAVALRARTGGPVTLVDMALPFGAQAMMLDLAPTRDVGDLIAAGAELDDGVVAQAAVRHPEGIDLIDAPRAATVAALCRHDAGHLLGVLRARPGVVVIDLGSTPELAHVSALEAADLVVMPVSPRVTSAGMAPRARAFLAELGVTGGRLLPVLVNTGPEARPIAPDVLAKLLGAPCRHHLPYAAEVAQAIDEGRPYQAWRPTSPLARAIDGLADDVLVRTGLAMPAPATRGGALDRLREAFARKEPAHVRA